jgi:chromosome segregation ATPase
MPDWLVTLLVAGIAAFPGTAAWYKARSDNNHQKQQRASEREQLLRDAADAATATAISCMEAATKELHLELNDTREQLRVLRERLAETERQLAEMRRELEAEHSRSAQTEARMMARIAELEAERAALLLRIEELEGRR